MNVDPSGQFFVAAIGAVKLGHLFLMLAAGILAVGIANTASAPTTAPAPTLPGTISRPEDIIGGDTLLPKARAKDDTKTKEKEKTVKIPPADTVVYRYGGTNPGNFVPREGIDITGLSFSTKPPVRGKAAVTTIGALNATGMVLAFQDGATHVSVLPNPSVGTIDDWIAGGVDHPCTNAVKSVCVKWDGCQ